MEGKSNSNFIISRFLNTPRCLFMLLLCYTASFFCHELVVFPSVRNNTLRFLLMMIRQSNFAVTSHSLLSPFCLVWDAESLSMHTTSRLHSVPELLKYIKLNRIKGGREKKRFSIICSANFLARSTRFACVRLKTGQRCF